MLETVEKATSHALRLYAATFPQRKHIRLLSEANSHTGWEGTAFSLQLGYEEERSEYIEQVLLKWYHGKMGQKKGYTEWLALRQLAQCSYPVPRVLASSFEHFPLEQACVLMEGIQGPGMGQVFLSSPEQEQLALIQQCCQLQVTLHTTDWQMFVPDPDDYRASDFLRMQLAEERKFVEQSLHHIFASAFDWLYERCAHLSEPCFALIHGDFHLDNILLRSDGNAVVIDWTGFDVSDYRFDLARTLLIAYLNMPDGWMEMIREAYEKARGQNIEHLEYFEVIACIDRLANMFIAFRQNEALMEIDSETIKQYVEQSGKLSLFLQERIGHPLSALEYEIACVNEKYGT